MVVTYGNGTVYNKTTGIVYESLNKAFESTALTDADTELLVYDNQTLTGRLTWGKAHALTITPMKDITIKAGGTNYMWFLVNKAKAALNIGSSDYTITLDGENKKNTLTATDYNAIVKKEENSTLSLTNIKFQNFDLNSNASLVGSKNQDGVITLNNVTITGCSNPNLAYIYKTRVTNDQLVLEGSLNFDENYSGAAIYAAAETKDSGTTGRVSVGNDFTANQPITVYWGNGSNTAGTMKEDIVVAIGTTEANASFFKLTDENWTLQRQSNGDLKMKELHTIAIADGITNGTVTADLTSAIKGTEVTLTVTPEGGYELDALTVKDGENNEITVNDNKFTMPASDVTVSATFKSTVDLSAADFVIGTTEYSSLKDAIAAAPTGTSPAETTIIINKEEVVVSERLDIKDRNVKLVAGDGKTVVIKRGDKYSGIVLLTAAKTAETGSSATLTIEGITLDGNNVEATSTFIEGSNSGSVVLKNVKFQTCKATKAATGAAIVNKGGGKLTLDGVSFSNCVADDGCGMIFVGTTSVTLKTSLTFTECKGNHFCVEKAIKVDGTINTSPSPLTIFNKSIANGDEVISAGAVEDQFAMANEGSRLIFADGKATLKQLYSVTIAETANGTVTASPVWADANEVVTLTVTPDSGYQLGTISAKDTDDADVTISGNKFTMPAKNVTVTTTFSKIPAAYIAKKEITLTNQTQGTKTGTVTLADGSKTVAYTAANDAIWYLGDIDMTKVESIEVKGAAFASSSSAKAQLKIGFLNGSNMIEKVTAANIESKNSAIRGNNIMAQIEAETTVAAGKELASGKNVTHYAGADFKITADGVTMTKASNSELTTTTLSTTADNLKGIQKADGVYQLFLYGTASSRRLAVDQVIINYGVDTEGAAIPDGAYTDKTYKPVQYSGTRYNTIAEAMTAVGEAAEATITLGENVVIGEKLTIPAGKTITLQKEGETAYTISGSSGQTLDIDGTLKLDGVGLSNINILLSGKLDASGMTDVAEGKEIKVTVDAETISTETVYIVGKASNFSLQNGTYEFDVAEGSTDIKLKKVVTPSDMPVIKAERIEASVDGWIRSNNASASNYGNKTMEMANYAGNEGTAAYQFWSVLQFKDYQKTGKKVKSATLRLMTERVKAATATNVYQLGITLAGNEKYAGDMKTAVDAALASTAIGTFTVNGQDNKSVATDAATLGDDYKKASAWTNDITLDADALNAGKSLDILIAATTANSRAQSTCFFTSERDEQLTVGSMEIPADSLKPALYLTYEDIVMATGNVVNTTLNKGYTTLAEALADEKVADGNELTLNANVTETAQVTIKKKVTIKGNGKTIKRGTAASARATRIALTRAATGSEPLIVGQADFTLDNVKIDNGSSTAPAISVAADTELTLEGEVSFTNTGTVDIQVSGTINATALTVATGSTAKSINVEVDNTTVGAVVVKTASESDLETAFIVAPSSGSKTEDDGNGNLIVIPEGYQVTTLASVGDTEMRASDTKDQNRGKNPTVELKNNTNEAKAAQFYGVMAFELPDDAIAEATGSDVKSAKLRLVAERIKVNRQHNVYAFADFDETKGYVTYKELIDAALKTTPVATFTANGASTAMGSDALADAYTQVGAWTTEIDLTAFVNNLRTANTTKVNLLIVPQAYDSGSDAANKFYTKEATDVTNAKDATMTFKKEDLVPRLTIIYKGGAAPVSVTGKHPMMLHTKADIDRVKSSLALSPVKEAWEHLQASKFAKADYAAAPVEYLKRMDEGNWKSTYSDYANYTYAMKDANAAYQLALRYQLSGDTQYADAAVKVLNAWATTNKGLLKLEKDSKGNAYTNSIPDPNEYLILIQGHQFANAAELLRDYTAWKAEEQTAFKTWMKSTFVDVADLFLGNHHGQKDKKHYWLNWDLAAMTTLLSYGILADENSYVEKAIQYYTTENLSAYGAAQVGFVDNAIVARHKDTDVTDADYYLGQCQESGRDQGHSLLDVALLGAFCQMATNATGTDYFAYAKNGGNALEMAEYVAKYNLGKDVPFSAYKTDEYDHKAISADGRGQERPVWELFYGYAQRSGKRAIYSKQWVDKMRAANAWGDGGAGDYGDNSNGFDQLGYGTLMYGEGVTSLALTVKDRETSGGATTKYADGSNTVASTTGNTSIWYLGDVDMSRVESIEVKGAAFVSGTVNNVADTKAELKIGFLPAGTIKAVRTDSIAAQSGTIRSSKNLMAKIVAETTPKTMAEGKNATEYPGADFKISTTGVTATGTYDGTVTLDAASTGIQKTDAIYQLFLYGTASSRRLSVDQVVFNLKEKSAYTDNTGEPLEPEYAGQDTEPITVPSGMLKAIVVPNTDTYVRKGNTGKNGSKDNMEIYTYSSDTEDLDFVGIMSFSLPERAKTSGAQIEKVQLRLVTKRVKGSNKMNVYGLNADFDNNTVYSTVSNQIAAARAEGPIHQFESKGMPGMDIVSDVDNLKKPYLTLNAWTNLIDLTEYAKSIDGYVMRLMLASPDNSKNAKMYFTKEVSEATAQTISTQIPVTANDLIPVLTIVYKEGAEVPATPTTPATDSDETTYDIPDDAVTSELKPNVDTYVRKGNTANNGAKTNMEVYTYKSDSEDVDFVGLLSFQMPVNPNPAKARPMTRAASDEETVYKATLRLVTKRLKGGRDMNLYEFGQAFAAKATYAELESAITAARASGKVKSFKTVGMANKDVTSDQLDATYGSSIEKWTNEIDVTELVRNVSGTTLRLMLTSPDNSKNAKQFFTAEAETFNNAKHPDLIVDAKDLVPVLTLVYNGDATGIRTVTIVGEEVIYDLRGNRVENPGKGVYIINGKKVIRK